MTDEYLKNTSRMVKVKVTFDVQVTVAVDANGKLSTTDAVHIDRALVAQKIEECPLLPDLFAANTKHKVGYLRVSCYDDRLRTHILRYWKIVKVTPKLVECAGAAKFHRETCQMTRDRYRAAHPYDVAHAAVVADKEPNGS